MSRRKRSAILILSLLLLTAFIFFDHSPIHIWQTQPRLEGQAAYDFQKYHEKTFTVVNVVDGDTLDIDVPDGEHKSTRIRLLGVDTPETKHPTKEVMYFGPEATEFTKNSALGKRVTIYLDQERTRGYFGRLLAYVKLPDGRFLNEALLTEGFAYADARFSHSLFYKYKQLEAAARSAKKGLWKNVTPDQMPHWRQ